MIEVSPGAECTMGPHSVHTGSHYSRMRENISYLNKGIFRILSTGYFFFPFFFINATESTGPILPPPFTHGCISTSLSVLQVKQPDMLYCLIIGLICCE